MKAAHDTDPFKGSTVEHLCSRMDRAARFASEIKRQWRNGTAPNTPSILAKHPQLLRYRSVVLDLAHEEYLCRQAAGESMNSDQFVKLFPGLERSLHFLIEVRRMLQQDHSIAFSDIDFIWPKPGDEFLGFPLLAELGQGTFGHVFLAMEPSLGNRLVALKVAPQGQWEAGILGKLAHPNIVPVYSIQTDHETGLTAVCMPYLGRITLLDVIDRAFANSRLPRHGRIFLDIQKEVEAQEEISASGDYDSNLARGTYVDAVIHLATQLAEALAFTHAQGICHRDLKPSNVLLSQNGRPLLLDFNLSGDQEVPAIRIGGTLPYMAPEQLRYLLMDQHSDSSTTYTHSDIFSLGVILYELLSGSLPFGPILWKCGLEKTALDLLARQRRGPLPLRELNKNVDPPLALLVEKCLAYDPRERPPSAESLAISLGKQKQIPQRAKRWVWRHPLRIVGIGTLLFFCVFIFGLSLAFRDPAEIRLYKEGLQDLQQGNPAQAIERFSEALQASPENMEILLARGKAYHQQGKYPSAYEDYQRVDIPILKGEIAALEGHCLNKMKYHRVAIVKYQQALQAGYQSAILWNNLGLSSHKSGQLSKAEDYFRKAISLDPRSSTIWRNMVRLMHNQANHIDLSPQEVLELVEKAVRVDDPTPELYIDVAILESRMIQQDPSFITKVFDNLKHAVSLGADPEKIFREPHFIKLRDRKEFSVLLRQKRGDYTPRDFDGFITPL